MIRQSRPVLRSLPGVLCLHGCGASSKLSAFSCVLSSSLISSAPGAQHTSSSAAGLATATQQLVKLQQQHEQQRDAKGSGGASWGKLLGAGAAAAGAAAVGWAAWSESTAKHAQARAEESRLAFVPRTSPKAQAALVSCYLGPLVTLLHGLTPTQPQLQSMAAAVAAEASVLTPWELLNALWGLAMFDAVLNPKQLQVLVTAARSQMQQLTVYQAVVAAWAVTMLCGSSSSSCWSAHDVVAAAKLCSSTWQQLLQRLQSAAAQEYDEAAVLYLLHAAVQQAAVAAADGNAAGRSGLPRATGHEVLHQLKQLPERVKVKVAAAYQEYVPFQKYIEGPYLTILHIAKALPAHISAAGAASPLAAAAAPSPYSTVFGAFSAGDADAARTVFSDSGTLGKLRRNLYFSWRSDELLDRHQQNLNQVAHVLSRRLAQQQVQQPPDVDVLLPLLKAAVFLDDDITHHQQQQHLQQVAFDAAMPFTARYWAACHDALLLLMRNGYSAPPGGFACKSTAGMRAAKTRCLEQRGWRVVHIGLSEVEACTGGSPAAAGGQRKPRNRPADYAGLERMLRQRLEL